MIVDWFEATKCTGQTQLIEYVLPTPDGQGSFEARLTPVDGERLLAIVRDITNRKQAEEALRTSEDNLRRAQAVAHIGSWNFDIARNITTWSAETYRIFGVDPETQLTYESFLSYIHPDDKELVNQVWQAAMQGSQYDIEHRIIVNGQVKWVHERAEMEIDAHGNFLSGVGTTQDISERKKMETALSESKYLLQTVIDTSPMRIFWKDRESRYLGCNPAFAADAGERHPRDLIGKNDYQLGWKDQAGLYRADDQQVMSSGVAKISYEEPQTNRNGQTIWLRTSKVPLRNRENQIIGILGVYEDVTLRKQAEELIHNYASNLEMRVEERTVELVRASRAKNDFLANMSHELRTPLNGILGFSETLLEGVYGPMAERQKRAVQTIHSSGEHLLGLINDILDVSKIEAGKFELQPELVDVDAICQSSLVFIKYLANKKAIAVDFSSSPAASTMHADPKRLKQILVNLLNNAVKFTPEHGSVKLTVQADAKEGLMRFSVTDTGIGIDSANIEKLFKPFVQLDSSLSRQYEGSGLGLTLVKQLVEMHGGSIEVQSEVGAGSCFAFVLPLT